MHLQRAPLYQPAHLFDHTSRTAVILADVGDDRAQLLEIGRSAVEVDLRRLGVAQYGAERLAELVGERGCELPERVHAAGAPQLRAQLLELLARLTVMQETAAELDRHDENSDEKGGGDE